MNQRNGYKQNLFSLTHQELKTFLVDRGFPKFSSDQIYAWMFKKKVFDFEKWSNVSNKLKVYLQANISLNIPKIVSIHTSKDGTRKFLLQMDDGEVVESVVIPNKDRTTICISSQIGCAMKCTFCHTGKMGFKRNLLAEEIVGQYLAATLWMQEFLPGEDISNLVFMGQGEPLLNLDNVRKAIDVFLEPTGLAIGQRKITLSTCGLLPQMEYLIDFPPVNIAISLHAVFDDIRDILMPINKKGGIEGLFKAIKKIPLKAHRRITYEYLLIDGVNDRIEDINELVKLLIKNETKINLIPFNEYPESPYKRPCERKIKWFQNELLNRGFVCTIRNSRGDDIMAACGQLNSIFTTKTSSS